MTEQRYYEEFHEFYVEAFDPYTMTPVIADDRILYDLEPMNLMDASFITEQLNEGKYSPLNGTEVTWVITDKHGDPI